MFALRLELLSGRYVATRYNDRDVAEWPPHPARLFSALMASYGEHEPDSRDGQAELRALQWLEAQPAPTIVADHLPESDLLGRRSVPGMFVPVNDIAVVSQPDREREKVAEAEDDLLSSKNEKERTKAEKALEKARAALAKKTSRELQVVERPSSADRERARWIMPEDRKKQERTFPSVTPPTPWVEFHWPESDLPTEHARPLGRVVARVSRVGHSSSLVALRVLDSPAQPDEARCYRPDAEGDEMLRWVGPGQAERLIAAHANHQQVEPRTMPAVFVPYSAGAAQKTPSAAESLFDASWVVLTRIGGPRLPSGSGPGVARTLNRALQSALGKDGRIPELLSGHRDAGDPSQQPHLAIVPLPYVGSSYADGSILGVALVFPRDTSADDRAPILAALSELQRETGTLHLHLGRAGVLELEPVSWERPRQLTVRSSTWTRPSETWITATPIALDRNPGDLHHADPAKRAAAFAEAERGVSDSVCRIGLPAPVAVEVSRSVLLQGACKPVQHPRFPLNPERPQRVLVHARIRFATPVRGPVLLGAGRYVGLGLCRPITPTSGEPS